METFYQLHERELSKAPFGIPVLGDEVIPELRQLPSLILKSTSVLMNPNHVNPRKMRMGSVPRIQLPSNTRNLSHVAVEHYNFVPRISHQLLLTPLQQKDESHSDSDSFT